MIGMTSATSPSSTTNNLPYINAEALIQSTRPDWSLLYYLYTPIRLCINVVKPHISFPRYHNPLTTIRQVSTTATSAVGSSGSGGVTSALGPATAAAGSSSSTTAADVAVVEEEIAMDMSIELVGRNQHRFKL